MDTPMLRYFEVLYREVIQARSPPTSSAWMAKTSWNEPGNRPEPDQVRLIGSIPEHVRTYTEAKKLVLDLIEACPDCKTVYDITPDGVVVACDCPPF